MPDERPNIVLIVTDQQRGDCLGIDGHPVLQTPNLDWIGRSGTFFRRGYSECPSCIPARRTLMSGQAPSAQGMVGYREGVEWNPKHTMAGELSKAGYQTEMIGKMHLYPQRKRYGFDHVQLAEASHGGVGFEKNDYMLALHEKGYTAIDAGVAHGVSANGWVGRPHYLPEELTHTFWCASRAIEFIRRRDPSVPFFLNVSMVDPHPPLTPPQWYYERYINRELPEPVVGDWVSWFDYAERGLSVDASRIRIEPDLIRCARAAYYGLINHIDDQVGRIMNFLKRERLFHNTFILFTSDHGEMLGDHNMYRKTFAYEASARVPFLAKPAATMDYPGEITTFAPVGWQDIMPTCLDVAGVDIPDTVTGRSILPLMRGEEAGWRDVLHGEHSPCYARDDGMQFLTDGHSKYVWYSQTGQEQLFNLDEDPNELHDIAREPDAEARVAPWRRRLVEILKDRPEGFSDGETLKVGCTHKELVPGVG